MGQVVEVEVQVRLLVKKSMFGYQGKITKARSPQGLT
ncbi:hypothetical protein G921_04313, partial [Escherichia coli UMEA 3155-1]